MPTATKRFAGADSEAWCGSAREWYRARWWASASGRHRHEIDFVWCQQEGRWGAPPNESNALLHHETARERGKTRTSRNRHWRFKTDVFSCRLPTNANEHIRSFVEPLVSFSEKQKISRGLSVYQQGNSTAIQERLFCFPIRNKCDLRRAFCPLGPCQRFRPLVIK
jgi:hypothetical protein